MEGKRIKRSAALILAIVMLFAIAMPAFAAETVTATTALNLRSGPGTNYPVVGGLEKGETATRVGTDGGWSILQMGNNRLYASSNFLSTGGSVSTETMKYVTSKVNVRTGPGTGYKALSWLDKGAAVSVLGTVGNWSVIKWNDGTAYVYSSYLSGGSGSSLPPVSSGLMVATSSVNVRSGPGTNYSIIGYLNPGNTVTKTGTSGSWTRIDYYGKTAYVHSAYLTSNNSGSSSSGLVYASGTMEATVAVNVRTGPGTNYSTIGTLYRGDRVTRTGIIGNWTQVTYRNKTGYVMSSYLYQVSDSYVSSANGTMRAATSATVRSGPGSNYSSMGTLRSGDVVTLTGYSGSWAQIRFNGGTGYVPESVLMSSDDYNVSSASGRYEVLSPVYGRSGPGNSYAEEYYFRGGEIVDRTGVSGNWARVKYGGRTVFVPQGVLSKLESLSSADKVMYVDVNRAAVYSEPVDDTNKYYVRYYDEDTEVRVTGENREWAQIGSGRYMRLRDLREADDSTITYGTKLYVKADNTTTYKSRTGGSTGSTTLSKNDELSFIETGSTSYYKVSFNGQTFYVRISDVQKTMV